MAQTCRQYWWNLQGRSPSNFNWDAIDHDWVVLTSASEYGVDPGDPAHSPRFVSPTSRCSTGRQPSQLPDLDAAHERGL